MTRTVATVALVGIAAFFCGVSYFALHDIGRFERTMRSCEAVATLDYSSLWMGGAFCFVTLPLVALSRNENWHRLMFASLVGLFFAVPFALHDRIIGIADAAGYSTVADPGLFHLDVVAFREGECGEA